MSATQLELIPEKAPKITEADIADFCEELRGKGWQTSAELGATTPQQKRRLRAMSEESGGRIVSYPGSPGYILSSEAVLEDFLHGDRATRSGLRKQIAKWSAVIREMHKLGIQFPADYEPEKVELE